MSALGTWVEFTAVNEKSLSSTNPDLMHGIVVSIGDGVSFDLKKGDKIVVSTVKRLQDFLDGEQHYFVNDTAVIKKL